MSQLVGRAGIALGVVAVLLITASAAPAANVERLGPWRASNHYLVRADLDGRRTPRLADRAVVNHLRAGEWVGIECQTLGETAYGSQVWDRVRGLYVPDKFIRTFTDGFLAGVPRCQGTAKPPPPRRPVARAACDQVREGQKVTIDVVQRYTRHAYDRTQVPSVPLWSVPDRVVPMGSLSIGGITCKTGGKWRVMSPLDVDSTSAGLDGNGNPRGKGDGRGLGISVAAGRGPAATRDGYLDLDAIACKPGRLFTLAGQVADLVVPKLIAKIAKPILRFALSKAYKLARHQLPADKVKCRRFAKYRVPVSASPSGKLTAYAESIEYTPLRIEQQAPGGNPNIIDLTMWAPETR